MMDVCRNKFCSSAAAVSNWAKKSAKYWKIFSTLGEKELFSAIEVTYLSNENTITNTYVILK